MNATSIAPAPVAAAGGGPLPPRPRLVLRVGFAGRRDLLPEGAGRLDARLREVFHTIGHRLAAIVPGVPVAAGSEPRISQFYERRCPLLRLVTGLCEGADAVAAEALRQVRIDPDPNAGDCVDPRCLETELAAVIPFDVETYRSSRSPSFQPEFDRQLAECAWVLALDGIYEKPSPDTPRAINRRARAYRAQSAFLLRQCDILIAAADPADPGRAGGTMETAREALAFELPVVLIDTSTGGVRLIEPEEHLPSVLDEEPLDAGDWQRRLREWVDQITADPDVVRDPAAENGAAATAIEPSLLKEYFSESSLPRRDSENGKVRTTFRERVWSGFQGLFRSGPRPKSDPPLAPYKAYRQRATELNRYYSGQYRGAFLLNYGVAMLAVALAALTLGLLALVPSAGPIWASAHDTPANGLPMSGEARHAGEPEWLLAVLVAFAVAKLLMLVFIARNTSQARRKEWNDRGVDYRYLAERLRGMYYLPRAGSCQPPTAAPPQFASRVVRQSAVDWLFDAIVRAISPADLPDAAESSIPACGGSGRVRVKKLLTLDPKTTADSVRNDWISNQVIYHEDNARTMHKMHEVIQRTAETTSRAVIWIVAADILVLGIEATFPLDRATWGPRARAVTLLFLFCAAVLPALVAALNGIRFQSECQHLAERSDVMRMMLGGRRTVVQPSPAESPGPRLDGGRRELAGDVAARIAAEQASPATDPGSWSHDVLRLTERVATDFVREAAEWSVLYAKEVPEG